MWLWIISDKLPSLKGPDTCKVLLSCWQSYCEHWLRNVLSSSSIVWFWVCGWGRAGCEGWWRDHSDWHLCGSGMVVWQGWRWKRGRGARGLSGETGHRCGGEEGLSSHQQCHQLGRRLGLGGGAQVNHWLILHKLSINAFSRYEDPKDIVPGYQEPKDVLPPSASYSSLSTVQTSRDPVVSRPQVTRPPPPTSESGYNILTTISSVLGKSNQVGEYLKGATEASATLAKEAVHVNERNKVTFDFVIFLVNIEWVYGFLLGRVYLGACWCPVHLCHRSSKERFKVWRNEILHCISSNSQLQQHPSVQALQTFWLALRKIERKVWRSRGNTSASRQTSNR